VHFFAQVLLESGLLLRKGEGVLGPDEWVRINFEYKPPVGTKPQVPVILRPTPSLMKQVQQNSIDEGKIIK
jgi:hypothetical protein